MSLQNVVGQEKGKQILMLLTQSWKRKNKIPPVGIFGPSGLGKTHLVTEWCNEIGAKQIYINGVSVKDCLAFRAFFEEAFKDPHNYYIVFVDECHNLPRKVQDNLLSVLEDPAILCTVAPKDMGIIQCANGNRQYIEKGDIMREALPLNVSFALATTDPAKLKDPILNRLRKIYLEHYTLNDKIEIAMRHLNDNNIAVDQSIYKAIASRCRSIRHLKSELAETYIDIKSLQHSQDPHHHLALLDDLLGIDGDGATEQDKEYLEYLRHNKTAGLDTLAGYLQVDKQELTKNIEPFLLQKGWLKIQSRGRSLTQEGLRKLGAIT